MAGFASGQIALLGGARVIASAGETFADCLRALSAKVTPYGDGTVLQFLSMTVGDDRGRTVILACLVS